VYTYDNEYRRQYCRDHVARMQAEYRRAQRANRQISQPRQNRTRIPSIWAWARSRSAQHAPAYRA
jgi:hypothetical protein